MADLTYLDFSNFFIHGRHIAAVKNGRAKSLFHAFRDKISDQDCKFDIRAVYSFIAGPEPDVKRAVLVGSNGMDGGDGSFWNAARRTGFEVITKERNAANREKMVDTQLVVEAMHDATHLAKKGTDTFNIVAGDSDYVPLVNQLIGYGFHVELLFWDEASQELINCCTKFSSMEKSFNLLRLK